MKSVIFLRIILTLAIVLANAYSISAQPISWSHCEYSDIPLNEDIYVGIYEAVDVLQSNGLLSGLRFYDRPLTAGIIKNGLQNINPRDLDFISRRAYEYLKSRLADFTLAGEFYAGADIYGAIHSDSNSDGNWGLFPRIEYNQGNFYFTSRYTIESALVDDPRYLGKKWDGFAGYGSSVYGTYSSGGLNITLGRQRYQWGPGETGSLILNGASMPYDGLYLSYALSKNILFSTFTFVLDPLRDSLNQFEERYLSGHRLVIKPIDRLTVGLSEVVIYGGYGRNPEVYYAIPLFFLHGAQLNQGRDDNTLIEADFRFYPGWEAELYGQFLIDDMQIENKTLLDKEPAEYGLLLGFYRSGLPGLRFLDIRTEYVRITNRTYNQPFPRNRYLNRGYYIGHPLGNDADEFLAEVGYRPTVWLSAKLGYNRTRRGEGRVENPWDEPWMSVADYHEKFPTGIIEKTNRLQGEFECDYGTHFVGLAEVWYEHIRNDGNIPGKKNQDSGIKITIGATF